MVAKVDHNAIKFNQVSIAVVSTASFLGDLPHLAGLLAVVLAVATARPAWDLFRALYQRVVLPLRWLRPHVLDDDPAPHRFAQGIGAAFLGLGWIALISGASRVGSPGCTGETGTRKRTHPGAAPAATRSRMSSRSTIAHSWTAARPISPNRRS